MKPTQHTRNRWENLTKASCLLLIVQDCLVDAMHCDLKNAGRIADAFEGITLANQIIINEHGKKDVKTPIKKKPKPTARRKK